MNRFAINGGSLNGSALALVIASAAIVGSASATAAGFRSTDANSPVYSGASVTAVATKYDGAFAGPYAQASIVARAQQQSQVSAAAGGSAGVTAFVLRQIPASSEMLCGADIVVIPASIIGSSSVSGSASIAPAATRVQPGRAGLDAVAGVTIAAQPVVNRYVVSQPIAGSCAARVESAVNGILDAYASPLGSASVSVVSTGLVTRPALAPISCTSVAQAIGTRRQPGGSEAIAIASIVSADPFILGGGVAHIGSLVDATASATRVLLPSSTISSSSLLLASSLQQHAAHCALFGQSALVASGQATTSGAAVVSGSGSVLAVVARMVTAEAAAFGSCSLAAMPSSGFYGAAEISGSATASADCKLADQGESLMAGRAGIEAYAKLAERGQSSIACGAEITADGLLWEQGLADIDCDGAAIEAAADRVLLGFGSSHGQALAIAEAARGVLCGASLQGSSLVDADPRILERGQSIISGAAAVVATGRLAERGQSIISGGASIQAEITRRKIPSSSISGLASISAFASSVSLPSAMIRCSCSVFADTIANADSIDPEERTFRRQPLVGPFTRSAYQQEFRRAA